MRRVSWRRMTSLKLLRSKSGRTFPLRHNITVSNRLNVLPFYGPLGGCAVGQLWERHALPTILARLALCYLTSERIDRADLTPKLTAALRRSGNCLSKRGGRTDAGLRRMRSGRERPRSRLLVSSRGLIQQRPICLHSRDDQGAGRGLPLNATPPVDRA